MDPDGRPAPGTPTTTPTNTPTTTPVDTAPAHRPARGARAGWALMGFAWFGATIWLLVQFVGTTWDAGVLLVQGEVVTATVVETDLRTKWGREDTLVVTTGPPYTGRAEIATFREDIPVGAVVEVVVDPDDPSRASLAEDGWPWWTTLYPLFLLPFTALGALLGWAYALDPPRRDGGDGGEDDGHGEPDGNPAASGEPGAADGPGSGGRT